MPVAVHDALAAILDVGGWAPDFAPEQFIRDLASETVGLPEAVDAFGFEFPLTTEGVDFAVAVNGPDGIREALAVARGDGEPADRPIDSPCWRRVLNFCDQWARPDRDELAAVPYVFLEFDTSSGVRRIDSPSLFLHIEETAQFGESSRERILSRLASRLVPAGIDQDMRRTLERCALALPSEALLLHVGVMFSRGDALRLHLCLPQQQLLEYLKAIGWRGWLASVEQVQCRYGEGEALATLQLEVGKGIGERLDIEFSAPGCLEGGIEHWRIILNRMVEDHLCSASKHAALLAWPRRFRQPLQPDAWPCTIRQDLSHVKVTLRPDQPLRAKAYISVEPSFELFAPR